MLSFDCLEELKDVALRYGWSSSSPNNFINPQSTGDGMPPNTVLPNPQYANIHQDICSEWVPTPACVEWQKVHGALCDGQLVTTELKVYEDLSWCVIHQGETVDWTNLGVPVCLGTIRDFIHLCFVAGHLRYCEGFPVEDERMTRDKKGSVLGCTSQWLYYTPRGHRRCRLMHRATTCLGLVDFATSSTLCVECVDLRAELAEDQRAALAAVELKKVAAVNAGMCKLGFITSLRDLQCYSKQHIYDDNELSVI